MVTPNDNPQRTPSVGGGSLSAAVPNQRNQTSVCNSILVIVQKDKGEYPDSRHQRFPFIARGEPSVTKEMRFYNEHAHQEFQGGRV